MKINLFWAFSLEYVSFFYLEGSQTGNSSDIQHVCVWWLMQLVYRDRAVANTDKILFVFSRFFIPRM